MNRLIGYLLALLFLIFPISGDGVEMPNGQPTQIRTKVRYDSKISGSFFAAAKWSYPWWIVQHEDGHIENTMGGTTDKKELPKLKHTAKCFTYHQGEHWIRFCKATLNADGALELFIHDESASYWDNLRILVKGGEFTSQYWTSYPGDKGDEGLIWTTISQSLVLNKRNYRKGHEVRGRIKFTCLQEETNVKYNGRFTRSITIKGVFQTELE